MNLQSKTITSAEIKCLVREENTLEKMLSKMNYANKTLKPKMEVKLEVVNKMITDALERKCELSEKDLKIIKKEWKQANEILCLLMSTNDGNRRQNYVLLTLQGFGTANKGSDGDRVTIHVLSGNNPCNTKEQNKLLGTKTGTVRTSICIPSW